MPQPVMRCPPIHRYVNAVIEMPASGSKEPPVDNDKIKGKANEAAGTVRQKTGEMTGNEEMESKGTAQEAKGKGQGLMGKAKDKLRDIRDGH